MLRCVVLTALTAMLVVSCAAGPEPSEPQPAEPQVATAPTEDWQVRIDASTSATDPDDTPEIEFTPMGDTGFHYVGGPAGTLWRPGQTASGDYTLSATFTQNVPASHTSFYGLVFGGSDLGEPNQRYLYFQIAQNGTFLIKERTGDETAGPGRWRDRAWPPSRRRLRVARRSTRSRCASRATPCPMWSTVPWCTRRRGPACLPRPMAWSAHALTTCWTLTVSNFQVQ